MYVKRSAKFNEKEMRDKLQAQVKTETPVSPHFFFHFILLIFLIGIDYNRAI